MNRDLQEVITLYATSHDRLHTCLKAKSKPNLIGILCDLITHYFNDKNSSTLREFVTVSISGYTHLSGKIGYNGYRQDSSLGKGKYCEAKPKNYDTALLEQYRAGERKNPPAKLSGGGNFTDYSWKRLKKDQGENPQMLISGFVDGQLIYVLEFPFNEAAFVERLKTQLKKKFPKGDTSGLFLRSASFNYKHYDKSSALRINYLVNKALLAKHSAYIDKGFLNFLASNSNAPLTR